MILLLQLINRMIYLEYTKHDVENNLQAVRQGDITIEELCDVLGFNTPHNALIQRCNEVLGSNEKMNSAIQISFLRAEG